MKLTKSYLKKLIQEELHSGGTFQNASHKDKMEIFKKIHLKNAYDNAIKILQDNNGLWLTTGLNATMIDNIQSLKKKADEIQKKINDMTHTIIDDANINLKHHEFN